MPWIPTPTDGIAGSETLAAQHEAEQSISSLLTEHLAASADPQLQRDVHTAYLTRLLKAPLPKYFTGLDASRPWILYWAIHSLALLDGELDATAKTRLVDTLKRCQNPDGGFGGGPGQISHLAPTYAAVCALAHAGPEGWRAVDRQGMYRFLLSLKQSDGSFIMHEGGEVDVRGCYCALTAAVLLNILTPDLASGTASFIASCQTYEGGLAAAAHPFSHDPSHPAPLGEAHGGYAFCAAASWSMLRVFSDPTSPCFAEAPLDLARAELDVRALMRWSASLQAMPIEGGGFRGRTNKLVDGCYSWWCGGLFPIVDSLLAETDDEPQPERELFDRKSLQEYVTLVAQAPSGGLRDKPGKPADAYHTCYNLSGDSTAQTKLRFSSSRQRQLADSFSSPFGGTIVTEGNQQDVDEEVVVIRGANESDEAAELRMREIYSRTLAWVAEDPKIIVGDPQNELLPTHPLFNITLPLVQSMMAFFYSQRS